ncbi:MAG: hypothetical protein AB7Y74_04290 [Syntrophorhabdus sp.]
MKLSLVQEILEAEVLCENDLLIKDVRGSFACGLTSEMLLYVNPETLDITSLTNIHIIHAAQVMDAIGSALFGDKKPYKSVIMNMESTHVG